LVSTYGMVDNMIRYCMVWVVVAMMVTTMHREQNGCATWVMAVEVEVEVERESNGRRTSYLRHD
jgi:hypothetical protein